ncbi:HSP70-10 [Ramazzottius varieornatus]|uniref:HSP70-10 n=1 Tax=Ramazzottius varieornatus TaxID=947166 RepID=A0A1D1VGY9_RAMVA|nr:HSP70-10 [Ramazzottius varieornatus]
MMVSHYVRRVQDDHNIDMRLPQHRLTLAKLKEECEQAKRFICGHQQCGSVRFTIPTNPPKPFSARMSRNEFDTLCDGLFREVLPPVRIALQPAGLDKSKLNVVMMVGGGSRFPKIAELLKEYFGQIPVLLDDNCEYAIAMGAAKLASAADPLEDDMPFVVEEITPWSLGVEVEDGRMQILIKKARGCL